MVIVSSRLFLIIQTSCGGFGMVVTGFVWLLVVLSGV